jgi:hypothetical protein
LTSPLLPRTFKRMIRGTTFLATLTFSAALPQRFSRLNATRRRLGSAARRPFRLITRSPIFALPISMAMVSPISLW